MTDGWPILVHTAVELRAGIGAMAGPRAVVMTMGALHQGHLDLVDEAVRRWPNVVVTIFVNPLQFGPGEDFDAYPRTLEADVEALAGRGVGVVYAPSAADMYPGGDAVVRVDPGPAGTVYEGAIRPGHFAGVLTVVHKLLMRTRADAALFGQKDAQQLALVRQMVRDLDLPVEIVPIPIRRDADGLALSSRNRYLSPGQRERALCLPRAIAAGQLAADDGASAAQVLAQARSELGHPIPSGHPQAGSGRPAPSGFREAEPSRPVPSGHLQAESGHDIAVDYLDLVDPELFAPTPPDHHGPALLIGAIRVGATRLIDNSPVTIT